MKVAKFGGTSLANAFQIKKVCDIVLDDPERKIVVVSAPGKRTKDDIKVTDLLIAVAKARLAGNDYKDELEAVVARYKEIAEVTGGRLVPEWLDGDLDNFKGTVKNLPTREMIDVPVDEMLIVELYSK